MRPLKITLSTLFMVLYLDQMCKCGLHSLLSLHIGKLMLLPDAEPRITAELLFPCQYLSGTVLVTLYAMV